jgi:PTS system ascorbate-specific IIA component
MSLLLEALGEGSIRVGAHADDWQHAVRLAGDALVASGRTSDDYTQAMIDTVLELGAYIVIAPGLAMPHARPSEAVLHTGLSLVTLDQPVKFGHHKNDPVSVVFGLAALDHDRHLELLSEFAAKMQQPVFVNSLLTCPDEATIRGLFA